MVYQISGITGRINRESTSGRTIRQPSLTNRSGLGVLDNPHFGRTIKFFPTRWVTVVTIIFLISIVYPACSPRSAIESVQVTSITSILNKSLTF